MTNLDYFAKHPEELKAALQRFCCTVPPQKCYNRRCAECHEEFLSTERTEQEPDRAIAET